MLKFAQNALIASAIALTPLAAASDAQAGGRHNRNDAIALGVIGLATGVIVGSALANPQPHRRVYVERNYIYDQPDYYVDDYPPPPPRHKVYRPRPVYQSYGIEPWTGEWYEYCSQRYRSFNARTGTYVGYDGRSHFCNAG